MKTMKFFQANAYPGPGTHNVESMAGAGPAFSVGRGQRASQELPIYTDKYYEAPTIVPAPKIRYERITYIIALDLKRSRANSRRASSQDQALIIFPVMLETFQHTC